MITASVVLYHNDSSVYSKAIESFLAAEAVGELWVSDNSSDPLSHPIFTHSRVHYFHNGANLGFGAGHNRVIAQLPIVSKFHLILNPDVRFSPQVLPTLRKIMDEDNGIGAVMPRINFPDGSLQQLAKLLPTPFDLIFRRFVPLNKFQEIINRRYELNELPQDRSSEVPVISGCYMLVRTSALRQIGGFDERYFMYMEDVDLVRRLSIFSKILYVPTVSVIHDYAKGSYTSRNLLIFHIKSAVKYFMKWGWLFDAERSRRNKAILNEIEYLKSQDAVSL